MADVRISGRDWYWMEIQIYNLQYLARLYDEFEIILYNQDNNNDVVEIARFSTGYSGYSVSIRFHNLCPDTRYFALASAKWAGTWYTIGDVYGSTSSAPAPTWEYYRAISSTEIEARWEPVPGAWGYNFAWKPESSSTWKEATEEGVIAILLHQLSPDTTYECKVRAVFIDKSDYTAYSPFSTTRSATTDSVQIDAPLWWAEKIKALSPSSVQIGWYPGDHEAWWIEAKHGDSDWYDVGGTYDNIVILEEGAPNIDYYFRVQGYKDGVWGPYSSTIVIRTIAIDPPLWNGSQCYPESEAIHLGWYSVDWADLYRIYFRYSPGADPFGYVEVEGDILAVRVIGLESETTYYVTVEAVHLTKSGAKRRGTPSSMISLTTKSLKPDMFEWTNPKVSGGQFNLTAVEWNSFTTNINQVRNYEELPSYSFLIAYKGNNVTANMFNQANNAIGEMVETGISTKAPGDIIYASLFNTLRDKLNSV